MLTESLKDLLNKREPLLPILRPHVMPGPLGKMIQHPLIQEISYHEEMNALINKRYQWKVEAVAKAIDEKKWSSVIWLHERPYRLEALLNHHTNMGDKEYWECVGQIWIDSENIWQYYDIWRTIWEKPKPEKRFAMDDAEYEALQKLPNEITIYRGINGKGVTKRRKQTGLSWTTNRATAEWFSKRWHGTPQQVIVAKVLKSDVHAHFIGRNESEIVATKVRILSPK